MFLKGVQAAGSTVITAASRGLDAVSACAVKIKDLVAGIFDRAVKNYHETNLYNYKQTMKAAVKEFNEGIKNSEYRNDAERDIKNNQLECPGFFERGHGFDHSRIAYNCQKAYNEALSEYMSTPGANNKYDVSFLDAVRAARK